MPQITQWLGMESRQAPVLTPRPVGPRSPGPAAEARESRGLAGPPGDPPVTRGARRDGSSLRVTTERLGELGRVTLSESIFMLKGWQGLTGSQTVCSSGTLVGTLFGSLTCHRVKRGASLMKEEEWRLGALPQFPPTFPPWFEMTAPISASDHGFTLGALASSRSPAHSPRTSVMWLPAQRLMELRKTSPAVSVPCAIP